MKTTGIFCRPSCKSKPPKRENLCYFETAAQARACGFRPCKRCRSDLLDYQPMRDIAAEIKQKIDDAIASEEQVSLTDVGLTARRLSDIFKQEYGITPKEYADSLRLQAAQERLSNTTKAIIDIAYATGFSSLSAFHRFFKKHTGQTPASYRKQPPQNNQ